MKTIRRGVFETNSSSTHSITMCSREDFDAWKKGEVIFEDSYKGGKFVPVEKAMKELKEKYPEVDLEDGDEVEEVLRDLEYRTYDSFFNDGDFETYVEKHKTKGGEEIVAFGFYGSDR